MKIALKILVLLFFWILLSACTISHEFGPYKGKVVDAETNESIEGAVVFIQFFTEGQLSPGGSVKYFADAVEVLTDANGEFFISPHRINLFRVRHLWFRHGKVIIFKPGYGAYPGHIDTTPEFDYGSLPEDEYVTIKLPKLKTREERIDNLGNAGDYSLDVPYEKIRHILTLSNEEAVELGLEPEE